MHTFGLVRTVTLMTWLSRATGSTAPQPIVVSCHSLVTTSELPSLTTTSTVQKTLFSCTTRTTMSLTTTKSLVSPWLTNLESKSMVDTVSSPTTLCWTLTAVSTWKTLRAHLLQPLPCVLLLRTPTVRSRAVPSLFHPESRSTSILNPITGVAKSDLKSPSLMVQPIPGLLVRSPRTQHTTA